MATYAERFCALLSRALTPSFEVSHQGGDLVAARHRDGALLSYWLPSVDRRRPVQEADVRLWIETAVSKVRRDLPHFTPGAREAATTMLAELENDCEGCKDPQNHPHAFDCGRV